MPHDTHWARRLLAEGTAPDPRFTLANERTFLAWIRSGLGLVALGIAIATFVSTTGSRGLSVWLAAGLIALGGALSTAAWFRWLQVERAMRQGRAVPPSSLGLIVALGVTVLALLSLVVVLLAG